MTMTRADERQMLKDLHRIAKALMTIADSMSGGQTNAIGFAIEEEDDDGSD